MSLIDDTYFTNDIQIPVSKYDTIQSYIDRYEPQILIDLLGYELYNLVKGYDPLTAEQRIIDLVEGVDYTVNGHLCRWGGLINIDKISLVAYYVFFKWATEKETIATRAANIKIKNENADNVSYEVKAIASYNKMLRLYGYSIEPHYSQSAYAFFKAKADDYPELLFTEKKPLNTYGL